MVPPHLAAEAFKRFMAIPKSQIEQDISEGPDNYEPGRQRVVAFLALDKEDVTPERCAAYMHDEMIQACAAQNHPGIHEAVAFHLAGTGARGAARTVLFVAGQTGELGYLNKEMDRIQEASGKDFDEFHGEEMPTEYVQLAEKAGELLRRIEAMMVIDILNRYGLREHAELFETDEEAFDAHVREGYYVLFPEKRNA